MSKLTIHQITQMMLVAETPLEREAYQQLLDAMRHPLIQAAEAALNGQPDGEWLQFSCWIKREGGVIVVDNGNLEAKNNTEAGE